MALRRTRSARRRPRRRFLWANAVVWNGTLAANTVDSAVTPLGSFETDLGGDLVGWRIDRIIGNGWVSLNTTANAETDVAYAAALFIDDNTQGAIQGTGSDPKRFLWHRQGSVYTPAAITTAEHLTHASVDRFQFDVKARRVFRSIDDVFRATFQNTAAATYSLRYNLFIHVLLSKAA